MPALARRYGSLFGMAAIILFFWIALPDTFMTARNWINISQQLSMLTVVAVTMTVVMVMGDFDLSVGAMASLSGVIAAVLFTQGWPIPAALGAALAAGLIGGLFNGVLVSLIGILPFVATLATLTIFSGAAFLPRTARRSSAAISRRPFPISPAAGFPSAALTTSRWSCPHSQSSLRW
jgi:ribose transport system permease protein